MQDLNCQCTDVSWKCCVFPQPYAQVLWLHLCSGARPAGYQGNGAGKGGRRAVCVGRISVGGSVFLR